MMTAQPEQGEGSGVRMALGLRAARGFTLLEMTLAMFIFSLLMVAVFVIVRSVTQLSSDMTNELQRDARLHGFMEMSARAFRALPPEAIVRLTTTGSSGRYRSQLVLVGGPSPLSSSGGAVTVLETEEAPDGYLRIVLRSLTQEQAVAWEKGDSTVGVKVPLLDNVATLEWKFFNILSGEWEPVWNDKLKLANVLQPGGGPGEPPPLPPSSDGQSPLPPDPATGEIPPPGMSPNPMQQPGNISQAGLRPSMVELKFALGTEPVQRCVFWTPPASLR